MENRLLKVAVFCFWFWCPLSSDYLLPETHETGLRAEIRTSYFTLDHIAKAKDTTEIARANLVQVGQSLLRLSDGHLFRATRTNGGHSDPDA